MICLVYYQLLSLFFGLSYRISVDATTTVNSDRQLEGHQSEMIPQAEEKPEYEDEDGPWYLGKAKEEFYKRRAGQQPPVPPSGDEDPIQVRV